MPKDKKKEQEEKEFNLSFEDIANIHKKSLKSVKAHVVNGDVVKEEED